MGMISRFDLLGGDSSYCRYNGRSNRYSSSSAPSKTAAEIERYRAQAKADRDFLRLRQQFEATIKSDIVEIRPDTAIVFWPSEHLGNPPSQLMRWDDVNSEVNDRRIVAIEVLLNTLIPAHGRPLNDELIKLALLMKLDILLGPRTMEAQSKASQDFFCPERQLYRQFYCGVLTLLQQDFQEVLSTKGEQNAWTHLKKSFNTQKKLRVLLESIRNTYCQNFPFLNNTAQDFFKDLFKGDELTISWMELLEKAYQGLHDQPLLSPDTYTQEAMENQAMDQEIYAYQERAVKYLTAHPEEITPFAELLQVDFKEGSTREENIHDLAGCMASMPSRLSSACSEHFLKRDWFAHPEVVEQMVARGAPLAHAANMGVHRDPRVWQVLQKALMNYRPKDPCDEAFRQQLLNYAQNTDRNPERWSSVIVALLEAEQQSTSLISVLYPQLMRKEAHYWHHSSLFKLSEKWAGFLSEQSPAPLLLALSDWRKPKPLLQSASSSGSILQLKGQLEILTTVTGSDLAARWWRFVAEKPAHLTVLEADHVSFSVDPDEPNYSKLDALLSYCYPSPFTTLSFINTELTDHSLLRLFKKRIPTVQQLIFKQNLLTDKGLSMIAEELPYWPALATLDFSDNLITDHGVQALLDALPNSSITQIIFGDNPAVSEKMREAINAQLVENLTLQPLEQTTSFFSLFSSPRLLPRVKRQTVVITEEERAHQEAADLLAAFAVDEVMDTDPQLSAGFMVDLGNQDDEDEEAHLWIATLPAGSQTSTCLNLSLKQLQGKDVSVHLLMAYLSTCEPTLEEINFDGQEFKTINDTDFEALVSLFSRFPHLKVINFDNTWLSSFKEKPMNDTPERKRDIPKTSKLSILVKHLADCASLQTVHLRGTGNWFGKEDCVDLIAFVKAKKTLVDVSINEDAGTHNKKNQLKKALKINRDYSEPMERQIVSQRRGFEFSSFLGRIRPFYQPADALRPSEFRYGPLPNELEQDRRSELTVSLSTNASETSSHSSSPAFIASREHPAHIRSSSLIPRRHNTLSLTTMIQPASYAKWHTLVPWDGDELIFQCSTTSKSYECLVEQRNYFINTPGSIVQQDSEPQPTPQQIYYDTFYETFSSLMHACKNGPSGMVKMQEGILGQTMQVLAVPIEMISPSILSMLQLITVPMDEHERQAYYSSVNSVMAILERDQDQHKNFANHIGTLLVHQYTYRVHLLTKEQAKIDARKALDWVAYAHYEDNKLVKKPQPDRILTRRLSILMTLVFGYEESLLIPMPQSSVAAYKRFIENKPAYSIANQQVIRPLEKPLELQDLPVIPEPTKLYLDDSITNPQLRRFDRFARQVILATTKDYQKDFKHSLGYYERFFMPLLLGHGGSLSIEDCNKLNSAVERLPLPELLRYLRTEISPRNSGFRDASVQVRLIEGLTQPIYPMRAHAEEVKTESKKASSKMMSRQSHSIGFFEEQQRRSQRAVQREQFSQIMEVVEETVIAKKQTESSILTSLSQRNGTF